MSTWYPCLGMLCSHGTPNPISRSHMIYSLLRSLLVYRAWKKKITALHGDSLSLSGNGFCLTRILPEVSIAVEFTHKWCWFRVVGVKAPFPQIRSIWPDPLNELNCHLGSGEAQVSRFLSAADGNYPSVPIKCICLVCRWDFDKLL